MFRPYNLYLCRIGTSLLKVFFSNFWVVVCYLWFFINLLILSLRISMGKFAFTALNMFVIAGSCVCTNGIMSEFVFGLGVRSSAILSFLALSTPSLIRPGGYFCLCRNVLNSRSLIPLNNSSMTIAHTRLAIQYGIFLFCMWRVARVKI